MTKAKSKKPKDPKKRVSKKITLMEAYDILSVKSGADVYNYLIAGNLRSVQKKQPDLIQIGKAMAYEGDGTDQMPYFGAIATKKGVKVATEIVAASKARGDS